MDYFDDIKKIFYDKYHDIISINKKYSYKLPKVSFEKKNENCMRELINKNQIDTGRCIINIINGNFTIKFFDFKLICIIGNLNFVRKYDSKEDDEQQMLGNRWNIDFEDLVSNPDFRVEYNENRIRKVYDRCDNYYEFYYIGDTNIIEKISTSCDVFLKFEYENNKIKQIIDNTGRKVRYIYKDDYLSEVQMQNGGKYKLYYNINCKKIEKIVAPNGKIKFQASYNKNGVITSLYKSNGEFWKISYDTKTKTTFFDSNDTNIKYKYNNQNEICQIDIDGKTVPILQKNKPIQAKKENVLIESDKRGNKIKVTTRHNIKNLAVDTFEYDAKGRMTKHIDARKNEHRFIYKFEQSVFPEITFYPNKYVLERKYDKANRLVEEYNFETTLLYKYNNLDLVVEKIQGNEVSDFRRYDLMGNLKEVILPKEIKDFLKTKVPPKKYLYIYDEDDLLIEIRTPSGKKILSSDEEQIPNNDDVLVHDLNGNICQKYAKISNSKLYQHYYLEYDKNSNIILEKKSVEYVELNQIAENYIEKTFSYDINNNVTNINIKNFLDIKYFYKGLNTLSKNRKKINTHKDHQIQYIYNNLGIVKEQIEFLDLEDAYEEGIDFKSISYLKIRTYFSYDENMNLIKITLASGEFIEIFYDADGNPKFDEKNSFLKDGLETIYEQNFSCLKDKYGRIIKKIYEDDSFEVFEYDFAGNICYHIDRFGNKLWYFFNSINKLKKISNEQGCIKEFFYGIDGKISNIKEVKM